jgi:hypothetical protein
MAAEKLSPQLANVLRASSNQDVVKLNVILQGHLSPQEVREVFGSLAAVDDVTSVDLLPRSKIVLLTTRKRSVPAVADLEGVLHVDLAKEAPLESLLDS